MKYYFITYQYYSTYDSSKWMKNDILTIHPFKWLEDMKNNEIEERDGQKYFVGNWTLINFYEISKKQYDRLKSGVFKND